MDTKKVLQQLLKIADNQQKIINKLAQGLQVDNPVMTHEQKNPNVPGAPSPTNVKHNVAPKLSAEGQSIMNALPPALQSAVTNIVVNQGVVTVYFAQGQKTQANYDAVKNTVLHLQKTGELPGKTYQVHVA